MSRQHAYQARHRAEGLCTQCSNKAVADSRYCAAHLLANRKRNRKATGSKPWRPGAAGRPPRQIAI